MSRTATIQTNFTGGEQSPELRGRVDVNKYYNAVAEMYNYTVKAHGGAKRRNGLRFTHEVADSSKLCRLIPFIFSKDQSYALEFGNLTLRINKDDGVVESPPGTPYQIATPYADTDIFQIRYTGYGDTRYLFHPSFPTRKLTRSGHASWKMVAAPFVVEPCEEQGYKPVTSLTLGAVTGTGITATAAADAFTDADVGREILAGDGRAIITGFTSTTQVTVDIVDDFAAAVNASGTWAVTLSPVTGVTPSAVDLGASITLTSDVAAWQDNAQVSNIGMYVLINDGLVQIDSIASDTVANGTVRSELTTAAKASGGAWTLEQKVWTATNGYPTCGTLFDQRLYAAGTTNYPVTVWGSKVGEFLNFAKGSNDDDAVSFTVVAEEANTIQHLACSADLLPLTFGGEFSLDGGGTGAAITPTNVRSKSQSAWGCSQVRPIRIGNEIIFPNRYGTKLRSIAYQFATDRYNAPDISLLSEHITSTYDPNPNQSENPADIGPYFGDAEISPIVDIAYQQDPDSRIWAPRADGYFLSCAYEPSQEVVGWSRCQTKGFVESTCSIPFNGGDRVWNVVRRVIGGESKRYVEYQDSTLNTDSSVTGAVDSHSVIETSRFGGVAEFTVTAHGRATGDRVKLQGFIPSGWNVTRTMTVTGTDTFTIAMPDDPGAATVLGVARFGETVWTGFDHLKGETLDVVGDMARLDTQLVSNAGDITTERQVFDLEAGLHYTSRLTLLPIESQAFGTAQGRLGAVYEIVIRIKNTRGAHINGKEIAFTKHGANVHDNQAPPFTGDKKLEKNGYDETTGVLTIEQPYPLPSEILAVIRKVNIEQ